MADKHLVHEFNDVRIMSIDDRLPAVGLTVGDALGVAEVGLYVGVDVEATPFT